MSNAESPRATSSDDQRSGRVVFTASEPGYDGPEVKEAGKARPRAQPIESVGQLLRAIYAGTFKRTTLKRAEVAAMRSAPSAILSERDELFVLALSDRTLDRTRQLMLIGTSLDAPVVAGQIGEFAREVLRHHPAFKSEALAGVLENLPEAATEDGAVQALTSQDYSALRWLEANEPMKKKEREQCKANAVHCLLLLFWSTRGTSVERIQRHLQSGLWTPAARQYKTDRDRLRAFITTRDPAAAALTYELLEKRAIEHSRRAEAARRSEESAAGLASQLEEQLASVAKRLAATQAEVHRIATELQETRETHKSAEAHWKDDYEQLRGQVLRRLKEELSLLDEGLHALRRDPPKVHVMLDHAERAIDGLKREMERLRERV